MSLLRPLWVAPLLLAAACVQAPGFATPLTSHRPSKMADAQVHPLHHSKTSHHDHHKILNVPAHQPQPKVQLVLHPDAVKGWNLEVKVENFKFSPERVNSSSQTTEGHGHLYIDGKKVTRLYSHWYYLPELQIGSEVRVSWHGNGHEALAVNNQRVEATTTLKIADQSQHPTHHH